MVALTDRILIVDDDSNFRRLLTEVFEKKGWVVHAARDGFEAIQSVRKYDPHIIVMDIEMPGRDGVAACRLIRKDITMAQQYPVILMGTSPNKNKIIQAIEAGCDDFILKPFKFDVLVQKVEKLIEFHHKRKKKEEEKEEKTDYQKEEQEAEIIVYSRQVIKKTFSRAMRGKKIDYPVVQKVVNNMITILHKENNLPLAFKMKSHNDYTYIHSINVASLCMSFAYHLQWDDSDLKIMGEGAFLQDIGKTKIDLKILMKPDKLTDEEFSEMMKHPLYAEEILKKESVQDEILKAPLEHHERIDGTGYPNKLKNGQISKFGRVAAIVDTYDALTTDRCYHGAVSSEEAIESMLQDKDKFDSELLNKFRDLVNNDVMGK